jgi:transcriptional regulator with XRE-family HTH domain
MITAAQLRAARGLMDWTRAELAKASGLSPETIKNIEHGIFKPTEATTQAISNTFAVHNVEFTENDGVRKAYDKLIVFKGKDGLKSFIDDLYQTALKPCSINGEKPLCACNLDDSLFKENLGNYANIHMERMSKIPGLEIKLISVKEEAKFPGATYRVHRYLPEAKSAVPFYVYDDKFAIINFNTGESPEIIIINSPLVAQSYREQFKLLWKTSSTEPPKKSKST